MSPVVSPRRARRDAILAERQEWCEFVAHNWPRRHNPLVRQCVRVAIQSARSCTAQMRLV